MKGDTMPNSMTKATSDELIERWIQGDREAAREIYDRYYRRALKFGMSITRREVEAEDLAQEAIAHGLDVVRDSERRPAKFTGWLLGVVKHLAWRRSDKRGQPLPADVTLEDTRHGRPSGAIVDAEMNGMLARALSKLPAAERRVMEVRFLEGLSRAQAAESLNCSLDTIDRRTRLAVARLRDSLSGHFTTMILAGPAPSMERVMELRPSFRAAFLARHVEGLSAEKAARKLGIPVATLEERLRYAYDTLGCSETSDFAALRRPV